MTDVAVNLYTGSQRKEDRAAAPVVNEPLLLHDVVPDISTRITRQPRRGLDCGSSRMVATHPNMRIMKEDSLTHSTNATRIENEFEKGVFRLLSWFSMTISPAVGIGATFHNDSLASVRGTVKCYRPTCFLRRKKTP